VLTKFITNTQCLTDQISIVGRAFALPSSRED
jgi:hypothetical protein